MKRIAIFASGSGTNAEIICENFINDPNIKVATIVVNRKDAGVIERTKRFGIPTLYYPKQEWQSESSGGNNGLNVLKALQDINIDWIVFAGFLSIIPEQIIETYNGRIINIHPSLLPKYGGQGMWGHHVHEAVWANHETETGITIHQVSNKIDGGEILFQAKCEITSDDTPTTIASKVHQLEYEHYSKVIRSLIEK